MGDIQPQRRGRYPERGLQCVPVGGVHQVVAVEPNQTLGSG